MEILSDCIRTRLFQFNYTEHDSNLRLDLVADKQGSQNIKHTNRTSGSCNKVFLFFQGVAIADDDTLIKRDVNVYRSHVKITAYNSRGYKVRMKRQISFLLIYNCKSREKTS